MIRHMLSCKHMITFENSNEKNFIWPKIAKTAGTSVKSILRPYYNQISRDEFLEGLTPEKLKRYFKFTIARNPWDRAVSVYKVFGSKFNVNFREFVMDLLPKVTARMDVKEYHRMSAEMQALHRHCIQQHYAFYDGREIYVDYIGRFETLDKDWEYISGEIGVSQKLPHLNKSKSCRGYVDFYDDETRDFVGSIFAKDIELLGYDF